MEHGTKQALVAVGIAAGSAALLGAILFWPSKASAATSEKKLPLALDVNLSADQQKEVARLLYDENDIARLSNAGYGYLKIGAPIAADLILGKAASMLQPALDTGLSKRDLQEILAPLFVWTDPIMIQSAGLVLQSKNYPKAGAAVMQRALNLSKLG